MRPSCPPVVSSGLLLAAFFLSGGCATSAPAGPGAAARYPSFPDARPGDGKADGLTRGKRTRVAQEAARQVGRPHVQGAATSDDASGLVRAAYQASGMDLGSAPGGGDGVQRLYAHAKGHGALHHSRWPHVGDLAFFHDTWDRNGDGLRNDPLTHVALVERVESDGTVVLVHRVGQGIVRQRMNLNHPKDRRDPKTGKLWNHLLRRAGPGESARTTAELFAGFATLYVDSPAAAALAAR